MRVFTIIYLSVICSFFSVVGAQTLNVTLDYYLVYENQNNTQFRVYTSSKNPKIMMHLKSDGSTGLFAIVYGETYDHYYHINHTKFPFEPKDFEYLGSKMVKSNTQKLTDFPTYKFDLIKENVDGRDYNINVSWKTMKMSRLNKTCQAEFVNFADNLATVGMAFLSDAPYQDWSSHFENSSNNYLLRKGTCNRNGEKNTLLLKFVQKQDLILTIDPKQIKLISK